jgi:hypothetical protein
MLYRVHLAMNEVQTKSNSQLLKFESTINFYICTVMVTDSSVYQYRHELHKLISSSTILVRHNDKPWISSELKKEIRKRDRLRQNFLRLKTRSTELKYKSQRNKELISKVNTNSSVVVINYGIPVSIWNFLSKAFVITVFVIPYNTLKTFTIAQLVVNSTTIRSRPRWSLIYTRRRDYNTEKRLSVQI